MFTKISAVKNFSTLENGYLFYSPISTRIGPGGSVTLSLGYRKNNKIPVFYELCEQLALSRIIISYCNINSCKINTEIYITLTNLNKDINSPEGYFWHNNISIIVDEPLVNFYVMQIPHEDKIQNQTELEC